MRPVTIVLSVCLSLTAALGCAGDQTGLPGSNDGSATSSLEAGVESGSRLDALVGDTAFEKPDEAGPDTPPPEPPKDGPTPDVAKPEATPPCDPIAETGCAVGEMCTFECGKGVAKCMPEGGKGLGEVCKASAECDAGLACGGIGRCKRICTADGHCSGMPGTSCTKTCGSSTYGLCLQVCDQVSQSCGAGQRCAFDCDKQQFACVAAEGWKGLGTACAPGECKGGLVCADSSCHQYCWADTDCPYGMSCGGTVRCGDSTLPFSRICE